MNTQVTHTAQRLNVTIQFSPADFVAGKLEHYDIFRLKGGNQTTRLGWPQFPVITKHFVLPAGAQKITLQVQPAQWQALPGRYTLAPTQPPQLAASPAGHSGRLSLPLLESWEEPPEVAFVPLVAEAAQAKLVAMPTAEVASLTQVGGRPVVTLRLHPLRYRPPTATVEVATQVKLRVEYALSRQRQPAEQRSPAALLHDMRQLSALVENPEDIQFAFPSLRALATLPAVGLHNAQHQLPELADHYPVKVGDQLFVPAEVAFPWQDWPYLIITDDYAWGEDGTQGAFVGNLVAEFESLARWKTLKGVRARVVTISDIVANKFGTHWQPGTTRDLPEAIRNFLKQAYRQWNTRWCLLGGDLNIVPTRHVLGPTWLIEKKNAPLPAEGVMYADSANDRLRFHSSYDFTLDDVFFATETGELVRYRANATTTQPGWYWTQADYTTKSPTATRYIVIRGSNTLLGRTFLVPWYHNLIPSDFYYSSVDSPDYGLAGKHDWDKDDNGFYGWYGSGNLDGVDFGADISVGRAPVNSTQTTHDFVDKVLTYEQYRDARTDTPLVADYVRKLAAVSASWGSKWTNGCYERLRWAGLNEAFHDKEAVIQQFQTNGVACDLLQRMYEDIAFMPQTVSDLTVLDTKQLTNLQALVAAGPHFFSLSGHGAWHGCAGFSSFYTDQVYPANLTNWPHLAIYFVDSCWTNDVDRPHWKAYNRNGGTQVGNPTKVCLGVALMRHSGGGALGYLGYTRPGGVGKSRELDFWGALSAAGQVVHLGQMQDQARFAGKDDDHYQAFIMTLLGDPELSVYTQPPQQLAVAHPGLVYGQDKLTVSVYHQAAPKLDCTVTVCQLSATNPLDKVVFPLVEAEAGHYTFDTTLAKPGELCVTVTAHNFVPYLGTALKVEQPVSPWKYRTPGFVHDLARRANASIYAASNAQLYALSPTQGHVWHKDLAGPVQALAAASDGSVLVGLRANVDANLLLLNTSGQPLRSWDTGQEVWCVARDTTRNRAYVGLNEKGIRAYDTATGAARWTRADLGLGLHLGLAPSGDVYASTYLRGEPPRLLKLAATDGSTRWTYELGSEAEYVSAALHVEPTGACYVSTRNHELHKVSATGSLVWKLQGGAGTNQLSTTLHALVRHGDWLYAGSGDGVIYAIQASAGTIAWQCSLEDQAKGMDRADCLAVSTNGTLYAGCWHGLCAISAAGEILWFREVTGGVLSLLQLGNRLYGGSRDGWVYLVQIDEDATLPYVEPHTDKAQRQAFIRASGTTRQLTGPELRRVLGRL